MGVGSRGLSRIDTAQLSNVLRRAYMVSWVMYPRELGALLRQAAELVRVDAASRCKQRALYGHSHSTYINPLPNILSSSSACNQSLSLLIYLY